MKHTFLAILCIHKSPEICVCISLQQENGINATGNTISGAALSLKRSQCLISGNEKASTFI